MTEQVKTEDGISSKSVRAKWLKAWKVWMFTHLGLLILFSACAFGSSEEGSKEILMGAVRCVGILFWWALAYEYAYKGKGTKLLAYLIFCTAASSFSIALDFLKMRDPSVLSVIFYAGLIALSVWIFFASIELRSWNKAIKKRKYESALGTVEEV